MNIAYPPTEFENNVAAIEGFKKLLIEGFENPENIRATVRLTIPEYPELAFVARYHDELHIEPSNQHNITDTEVVMPMATMRRIFKEYAFIDFRDPEIIGTMTFEGNLNYANHLSKALMRPTNFVIDRFASVGEFHAERGYKDLTEVEYLHQPSQHEILLAMEESRPVVITGLEPTPPCKDWTIDKLADRYGDSIVRVRSATQEQNMRDFVAELNEFIANPYDDMIDGFVKPYTEGALMPKEMWPDFGPLFFDPEDFIPPQLWLGAVPTHIPTSSLHRDQATGFLLQVIGRKRLDLYSADQADLIYPHKSHNYYQPCWFKPEEPNFEIFPKAKDAKYLSITLNPGELIIQPAGWFHQVYALDSPNMSVSYFWKY